VLDDLASKIPMKRAVGTADIVVTSQMMLANDIGELRASAIEGRSPRMLEMAKPRAALVKAALRTRLPKLTGSEPRRPPQPQGAS
jgi:hypothetical protein